MGPLGFAAFNTTRGVISNFGMLDQIQALKWLQSEVEAFGGNPSKVTIFGESAGGISTFNLVTSPAARGLFRGIISQSGCPEGPIEHHCNRIYFS